MPKGNGYKTAILGEPFPTAASRLRKQVLFRVLERHGENNCEKCKRPIDSVRELSIEHKVPWKTSQQFWDLDNVSFAHLSCNSKNDTSYVRASASG